VFRRQRKDVGEGFDVVHIVVTHYGYQVGGDGILTDGAFGHPARMITGAP
jgi:hypothetical protein